MAKKKDEINICWEKRLNGFIEMFDYGILQDAGKVSAENCKASRRKRHERERKMVIEKDVERTCIL